MDEEDLAHTRIAGVGGFRGVRAARSAVDGSPADRVHTDAVDLEVLRSAGVHASRLGDGERAIRLVRALGRWTGDDGAANVGWVDLVELP